MRFFSLLALAWMLVFPFELSAQGIDQAVDLSLRSTPTDPLPGKPVLLEAVSYSIDLDQATLTWTYGGKVVSAGTGKTRLSVIAPQSGQSAAVTVTVNASGISTVSSTIALQPGSVDLLWEALDASVPPFYKGRAILAPEGIFQVVAIPAPSAPKQSSFSWSRNNSAAQSISGLGRTSALFQNTLFNKTERVSVTVSGGTFQGSGSVSFSPELPRVVAYKKKEGFIDYANGFSGTIPVSGAGAVVRFEPFFFSIARSLGSDLLFDIKSGTETVFGDSESNEVRISRPEAGTEVPLSVNVTTATYSIQNAKRLFTLLFQ